MNKTIIAIGIVAAIVLVGGYFIFSGSYKSTPSTPQPVSQQSAGQATQSVMIANFSFQPTKVTIVAGKTVTWTNKDSASHTITADDGSFDSGPIAQGATFSHTFATAGTVTYHCGIHPSMQHASIIVGQ